ncbi:MAG: hypothetical protein KDA24_28705 [Deltaproteobacteria bacterium]|nr:hypothetical protein [Deltaproteobacteria bacterium]
MIRSLLAGLVLVVASLSATPAEANYLFAVPSVDMTARINPDASVQVEYVMEFANSGNGQTIDIVDIGMPTTDYDIGTMRAKVDGVLVTDIRRSTYVTPGVEVHLGARSIPRGQTGTLTFTFTHPDLVYSDTTDKELASFRITPTWFGEQYVVGNTDLKVAMVLPSGVEPEQVLHQGLKEFANKAKTGEGTVVLFHWPSVRFTGKHLTGISFPRSSMDRVVDVSRWELLVKAVEANPTLRLWLFLALAVLVGVTFFRFSGGTGFVVFLMLGGGIAVFSMGSAAFQILGIPGGIGLLALNETFLRKRKNKYLPPIAEVEGGGIKRGLTAPEAAVLLEEPLGKVLTLVIFGLLKKNVLELTKEDPFTVRVRDPFNFAGEKKVRRSNKRRAAAREEGVALRPYEEGFLTIIEDAPSTMVLTDLDFTDKLKNLVRMTADRLSGFDLSDSKDYYRLIIARALKEAEAAVPETEKAEGTLDRGLEWILLSESAGDVFDRYRYRPPWRRRYYYGGGHGGGGIKLPGGGGGDKGPGWTPGVGDAAAGYAGWAENVFGDMAGAILPGDIAGKAGGFLDLSGVDKVTGDILEAMAENSGSGGSGGGGGSCACACAGCACACACAGGGR